MTASTNAASDAAAAQGSAGASTLNRDAIQSIVDAVMNSVTTRFSALENSINSLNTRFSQAEMVADVGLPEAQGRGVAGDSHSWEANKKRSYDEYQDLALSAARRSQDRYDALMSDARHNINAIQKLVIDRLANANNNDEMAVDRKWNPDEQAYVIESILRTDTFKDAIAGAVAAAVAATVSKTS